ncbi:4-carboxymuconolactone decarboxylase [Agrobacterium tumefaciens]|uniref:carboxymuconolactone decarboxylase family protein n=1 Tax=Agrobacterium TaxID=357 RepID=UPI000DD01554|nr:MULTISPECIES: carboxymuconolactone decarboxylase family protein [Agrobacterium]MBP2506405.1 4-carboxymuconolactone decarboxylase [Agrobacterium tumefaciens]MBP2517194.1 4-carboxymuconolactone decarboxylase [Agrobacterium tumefaciens]MBP2575828.1 4-carboxymuconolactone decarboxylase [Agrobacterium tumefaciens]MBP2592546.1 4-carboxymuconolactone decarboxylase [Agrobacterium tumefaciens]MCZ7934755.1 carboxymuconolactone decarboxylase family protein [Agrobacterium leguminum]
MKLTSAFIVMTVIVAGTNSSSALAQQQPSSNLESAKSRTQQLMGGVAPKLADLTDDVLYADIWERPELSKRDRSLVTVSALIALNRPDQLRSHLQRARDNGLTETELVETITHMAFYSGWPSAVSAVAIAKEVFAEK